MLLHFLHFPSVSGRNTIKCKTHKSIYLYVCVCVCVCVCVEQKRKIRCFSYKHIETIETESNSIFECEHFFFKLITPPVYHVVSFTGAIPTKATSHRLQ